MAVVPDVSYLLALVRDAGHHGDGGRVPLSMSAVLSLLASTTRLEILAALGVEPRSARRLASALNLSVPMAFHHLLALYQHDVVVVARGGDEHVYHLNRSLRTHRVGHKVRIVITVRNGDVVTLTLEPR